MGQTLENGVYLPSEGERNCYAGLKTNWEILDQKVADVTALQQAVAGALHREIVESLPTTDIDPNTIYMVLSGTSATENVYNEFMYVNNAWELIGTSATDLTNYYTKGEVDSKLLLKASASDLTSHTGDTTIHVTTADKTKWNNGVSQSYVFRYSSTALVASSTNSNTLLDNTDNLKVGDKVIDSNGVLFSITAIDTANSTFTIGTALVDLALDANVVHTSGNETISGVKTITNTNLEFKSTSAEYGVSAGDSSVIFRDKNNLQTFKIYSRVFYAGVDNNLVNFYLTQKVNNTYYISNGIQLFASTDDKNSILRPVLANNNADGLSVSLGDSNRRWSKIYGTEYYYGSNNIEFSTKFVTTDTAQDIEGNKNFKELITTSGPTLWPINTQTTDDITFLHNSAVHVEQRSPGKLTDLSGGAWNIANLGIGCFFFRYNSGTDIRYKNFAQNTVNRIPVVSGANRFMNDVTPDQDNTYNLGSSSLRWATINGVEPSSLSFPDLDNGIDISSYITDLTGASNINKYTPPVNGWISIGLSGADFIEMYIAVNLMGGTFTKSNMGNNYSQAFMPVIANKEVKIALKGSSIGWAKFYPCLGNV